MKSEKTTFYNFHNKIGIKFSTDNLDFFNFVKEHLVFFKTDETNPKPDLDVKIYFSKKIKPNLKNKLAKNLFFDQNQILYQSKLGFRILVNDEKPFQVLTSVYPKPLRDIYNIIQSGGVKSAQREKYLAVMRASLYLPLFYLLEKDNYIILHGSVVSRGEKAALFLGGNQVGKTTLSLNLVFNHNFKMLSDDYLIIKDNKIYAFPDRVRIGPAFLKSNSIANQRFDIKKRGYLIHSKYHLDLSESQIASSALLSKIFFLQLGQYPKIEKINIKRLLRLIWAVHNYIQELPENSYLSFLPQFPLVGDIEDKIKNLLGDKEIFLFQSGPDIKENINLLLTKLK